MRPSRRTNIQPNSRFVIRAAMVERAAAMVLEAAKEGKHPWTWKKILPIVQSSV